MGMARQYRILTPDRANRARLLHASLRQVRRAAQLAGSGATVHLLANLIATANSTLFLVQARASWASDEQIEDLLQLADECLRQAQILIARFH
jgi:hypothetical protein